MIGIVGGGITGLALARELGRAGADATVLEAEPQPGGVMRSVEVDGRVLDLGPQRTRLTPQLAALIDEVGLADRAITAPSGLPLWVYREGRLRRVPFGMREFLRTDLLSWRGKLRMLREPLTAPLQPDETAGAFFIRRFGEEAYRSFIGPLYGGLYAGDPERMPARYALSGAMRELAPGRSLLLTALRRLTRANAAAPPLSFLGGMQELPIAMYEERAERVLLGTRVRRIARRGAHWVLLTQGSSRTLECGHVVLTVGAAAAASLLEDHAPDAAARLRRLRHNPLAVVHLRADCGLEGLGYQVAFGEPLVTRGVTFNASLFGRDGVYTAYLGGATHPGIVEMPDDWVAETACNEFRAATGCDATVLRVSRTRIPAWDGTWSELEGLELPEGLHLLTNYTARMGLPGRLAEARRMAARLTGG